MLGWEAELSHKSETQSRGSSGDEGTAYTNYPQINMILSIPREMWEIYHVESVSGG